jgi:LPPG:FO 2-phospho-L-lactate transferase
VAISKVEVRGIDAAVPAPGVLEGLTSADLIVLCPSNPFVSIGPILSVPGVRAAIELGRERGARVAGVSPIIGGSTVKGPAARMLLEFGYPASAAGVAAVYTGLLEAFLIDPLDAGQAAEIGSAGIETIVADALMRGRRGEARLARVLLRRCVPGWNRRTRE